MFSRVIKKLPIRRKLMLGIVGVSVVVLAFSSAVMTYQAVEDKRQSIVASLSLTAKIIGENSAVPLVQDDPDMVSESLLALFSDETIRMGCVYDKEFKLFSEYALRGEDGQGCPKLFDMMLVPEEKRASSGKGFLKSTSETVHRFLPDSLIVMYPIEVGGSVSGLIYLVSDLSLVNKFIAQQAYST